MFNLIILSGLATMLREHITLEIYCLPIEQFDYAIASNLIALEDVPTLRLVNEVAVRFE